MPPTTPGAEPIQPPLLLVTDVVAAPGGSTAPNWVARVASVYTPTEYPTVVLPPLHEKVLAPGRQFVGEVRVVGAVWALTGETGSR